MVRRTSETSAVRSRATAAAVAVGLLSLAAAHASPSSRTYSGRPIDVLTYHYNSARTGGNPKETDLTVESVSSGQFGLLSTVAVQGSVLAQPLLVSRFRMPDSSLHDVLVVATETNDVYAIDAASFETLWHTNLGPPQNSNDLKCTQTPDKVWGVSATPVIARQGPGRATVFVVASTEGGPDDFRTVLHALDLADGTDLRKPARIAAKAEQRDGSTLKFSSRHQYARAGLAYHDGSVYVAMTSRCEARVEDQVTGWVLRYSDRLKQTGAFSTISSNPAGLKLGSVWAAGFAPAIDDDGTVFTATGNGDFDAASNDWGQSVLKLDAGLDQVDDYFTPIDVDRLNDHDLDLGGGGVLLVPARDVPNAPPMAVAMGKAHTLYLLDRDDLGHEQDGDAGALQSQPLDGEGVWGGPCYWLGPEGPLVYYQARDDLMRSYALETATNPMLVETAQGTVAADNSLPVVSSNGSLAGTGVLWTINHSIFRAYDAQSLQAPIFETVIPPLHGGTPFLTPLQANGRVYIGTGNAVLVYGLSD